MGLFGKKEMDMAALQRFWQWFAENEEWIGKTLHTHGTDVIWAIDEKLKPVFPYFKKELEFQLGYNNGAGEFFFYHFNNKNLKRDAETLKNTMPEKLTKNWSVILEA